MVCPGTRITLGFAAAISALSIAGSAQAQQTTLERIKRLGTISVCADPDRLPYSSEKLAPAGFDLEIAQEIAKELGVKLGYNWYSTHRGTKIVRQLAETTCDFFPGFPVDATFEEANFKIILTKPYYSSGFAVVARADAPDTILQDLKTKGVGVQMGTLPDFKLFDRGYERKLYRNTQEMIEAIKHKEIDAGVVPASEGGWELKTKGKSSLRLLTNTEKDFVFPMAIGLRKADKELRDLIDVAIDKLEGSGKLAEIFTKYGMVKLAGTGGGEPPKSKADMEKEQGGKDNDGPPKSDKKSDNTPVRVKAASFWSWFISPAAAEEAEPKKEFKPGEDVGADLHGLAINPEFSCRSEESRRFPDRREVHRRRAQALQAGLLQVPWSERRLGRHHSGPAQVCRQGRPLRDVRHHPGRPARPRHARLERLPDRGRDQEDHRLRQSAARKNDDGAFTLSLDNAYLTERSVHLRRDVARLAPDQTVTPIDGHAFADPSGSPVGDGALRRPVRVDRQGRELRVAEGRVTGDPARRRVRTTTEKIIIERRASVRSPAKRLG